MRHPILLLGLTLVLACASAETATVNPPPPPPAPPPPPPSPTTGPEVVVLDNGSVPTSGGVLTVAKPGNKLDGLTITVPANSYSSATQWTVTALDSVRPALPAKMVQLGPAIRIKNGQGYAKFAIDLSIPAAVGPDSAVAAFFYEPGSGTFELVPTLGRDGNTLLAISRHFSADKLLIPTSGAGIRAGALRGPPAFGEILIVLVATPDLNVYEKRASTFQPGVDDWEFPNPTTLLSDGICTGMTMAELYWHYMHRKPVVYLNHQFDKIAALWSDNPRGIRLASVIQGAYSGKADWQSDQTLQRRATLYKLNWSYVQAASLSMSIQITGLPQLVGVSKSGDWGNGHSVVGFAVDHGSFSVADPNVPGMTRTLQYSGGLFQPFPLSPIPNGDPLVYDEFFVTGATALLPLQDFATYFRQVDSYTIGNFNFGDNKDELGVTKFPPTLTQYRDELDTTWRAVGTPLTTTSATITVRTLCPQCAEHRAAPAEPTRTLTRVFTAEGAPIANDNPNDVDGVQLTLAVGAATFGVQQDAALRVVRNGTATAVWAFQDFLWLPVLRNAFDVAVNHPNAVAGDLLTFTALPFGAETPTSKYTWTFGDATAPATVTGNTQATHVYAAKGTYAATVEMRDAANVLLARGSVTVTIDVPIYTAWKITSMTTVIVNDTRGVDTRTAQEGNIWLNLVANHGANTPYEHLWNSYRADSTFFYTAQSTNAAIALVARDTLYGPPFAPTTGAQRSIYWWTYGSYPTAVTTLLSPGIIGSSNNLNRGGTSCRPEYSARFAQTGTTTAGRVTGFNWVGSIVLTNGQPPEPMEMFDYDITFNGDVATGTTTRLYRVVPNCTGSPEVTWGYRTTITATRIR